MAAVVPAVVGQPPIGALAMKQCMVFSFADMAYQFLEASSVVWSKDGVISSWKASFDAAVAACGEDEAKQEEFFTRLTTSFHSLFKDGFGLITSRDPAFFTTCVNEWTSAVDANTKYTGAHAQVQAQVWEYLTHLAQFANLHYMYSKCPAKLMDAIQGLAGDLAGQMRDGKLDVASINPMTVAQHIMGALTMEELEGFATSMMAEGGMDGIVQMLQSMLGGMGGGFGGLGGGGLGSLLGSLGGGGSIGNLGGIMSMLGGAGGIDLDKLEGSPELAELEKMLKKGGK